MAIRYTFAKCLPVTREMADRVRSLGSGGETCFDDADLRPTDEAWWSKTVEGIASSMIAACEARETPAADVIAETAYRSAYGDQAKDKGKADRLRASHQGGSWVLPLGFLVQGCERIYREGIDKGGRAIRARSALLAFAAAIAIECGCARVQEDAEDQAESEAL